MHAVVGMFYILGKEYGLRSSTTELKFSFWEVFFLPMLFTLPRTAGIKACLILYDKMVV